MTSAADIYTEPENLVRDFVSRGIVALPPERLGVSPEVHQRIYEQETELFNADSRVTTTLIPDVLNVLRAEGVVDACNQLVGKDWAVVPFAHNAPFPSGSRDQHWHKDDNAPYNSRKQRHHHAVQIELLYYPQAVAPDMGPTAIIPYSQYWTFNHEENHDNFAGADHLDFNYQLEGMERIPISGPNSSYSGTDIVNRNTDHDVRMRDAVANTGWPLVTSAEAGPLRAGSVVLFSHNLFHRGNHRRDDFDLWKNKPRFMWRFWLYRTTEPVAGETQDVDWSDEAGSGVTSDATTLWDHHYHWMKTGELAGKAKEDFDADSLQSQLLLPGDEAEPQRIGAAYKIAAMGNNSLSRDHLANALHHSRESVRRAATYGLVALGEGAASIFLDAASSPLKWVRKAGMFGIGEVAPLTDEFLSCLADGLLTDTSVYVRSVAAGAIGCISRRAAARGDGVDLIPDCVQALIDSLDHEENRLGMDRAQGRSIKFVRPTDESDVCEGIGVDFGLDRFEPVRSAVRENVLWSLVILSTHGRFLGTLLGPAIEALKSVVRKDANVISVGYAMDALSRLAKLQSTAQSKALAADLPELLKASPIRSWESLICTGIGPEEAVALEAALTS